jgi:methylated-DNA-[protein]-cysteine S-methyltransferase
MAATAYMIFDTALGFAAIAWSEQGVAGVNLPELARDAVRNHVARRFSGAVESEPPAYVATAIERVRALLRGEHVDFDDTPLDTTALSDFQRDVYAITRAIPAGTTLTYGEIAARTGTPRDARAVGQALGANPYPIIVPCHRVVAADGRMHGFSGPGGTTTKLRLLEIEGYEAVRGPSLFD